MSDPTQEGQGQVVVPLLPENKPPVQEAQPAPAPPAAAPQVTRWYLFRGTTILGVVFVLMGIAGFVVYLTTDKDHLKDHVFLAVCIGLIAFGAHLISRQSVKNFITDFGRFVPWGKKGGTEEQPAQEGE